MSVPIPGDPVAAGPIPRGNAELLALIKALQKRIDEMDRKTLYSAAISGGRLTIRGAGGLQVRDVDDDEAFYVGGAADAAFNRPDGQPQQMMVVRDDAGRARLAVWDPFPLAADGYIQNVYIWDAFGNIAVVTDNQGGLARPYLHTPFNKIPSVDYPGPTTGWANGASTAFERSWEANFPKQQPMLHMRVIGGVLVSGATAAYQIVANGVVVDSWTSTTSGLDVKDREIALPGNPYDIVQVGIECRRTGGTGNIYCHLTDAWQKQS